MSTGGNAGHGARVGIGIELGAGVVRAVRLELERPDALVAAEYPLDNSDERTLRDALVRISGVVSPASERPAHARIAVAPPSMLIQAVDVTGTPRHELLTVADRALRRNAADSMTVVDDGVRRHLVLVRWRQSAPDHLASLARQAGLENVTVEPAPLSVARVIGANQSDTAVGDDRMVVRRVVEPGVSWLALLDDGLTVAAASVATDLDGPTLLKRPAPRPQDDPDEMLGGDTLLRWLLDAADTPGDDTPVSGLRLDASSQSDRLQTIGELRVGAHSIPAFPTHDLRASERIAVALGAAVGAAGATERQRQIEPLASLQPSADGALAVRRPWAVERVERRPAPPAGRTRLLDRRARRTRRSDTSRRYGRQE